MGIIHAGAAVFDVLSPAVRYADLGGIESCMQGVARGLDTPQ